MKEKTFLTQEQQEIIKAVDKINEELYEKYDKKDKMDNFTDWLSLLPIVVVTIADVYSSISLSIPSEYEPLEIPLYNSENNDRIYYEKSDTDESFYKLIKRKFLEVKENLNKIKL